MRNKITLLFVALLALVFGIFQNRIQSPRAIISGEHYDRSIKVEYGVPLPIDHVIDGDTIVLANGDSVRLIGIDTPEEFDTRKPVQCYAKEAAERNKQLIGNNDIKFYKDISTTDKYGRWLGFVYLPDETFVNLELVKEGYAFAYPYPPDNSKAAEFKAAQDYAKQNKLGLWSACTVTTLSTGREQTNPVQ